MVKVIIKEVAMGLDISILVRETYFSSFFAILFCNLRNMLTRTIVINMKRAMCTIIFLLLSATKPFMMGILAPK